MTDSKKNYNGCWAVVIVLALTGYIMQKCEESKEAKILNTLKKTITELEKEYMGVYEGTLHDESYLPKLNIYPHDQFVTLKIISFKPILVKDDDTFYTGLSNSYNTKKNHIGGKFICESVLDNGERHQDNCNFFYFPDDKKFCLGSTWEDSKSGSYFGGDMCDVIFTPSVIELYAGNLKGKLYKK